MVCTSARADALSETCPARVADWHAFAPDSTGVKYGVVLSAASDRMARGQIVIQTNAGYFTFAFPNAKFNVDRVQFTSPSGAFARDRYVTTPLYVRFPTTVIRATRWWVTQAQTTGEKVLGWDARGMVTCSLSPTDQSAFFDFSPPNRHPGAIRSNPLPYDLTATPSASATILTVASTVPPGDTTCAKPFAYAHVTSSIAPEYPSIMVGQEPQSSMVVVEVAINADGTVFDTMINQSSGFDAFDKVASKAAALSTYAPAISFCKAVPGIYLFRADFNDR